MKTIHFLKQFVFLCVLTAFLCGCNEIGSAPSNVSGKTFSISGTGCGNIKIKFSSNSSATITNSYGSISFSSISYKKTGSVSATIIIKDILIEIYNKKGELIGRGYETDNISLIFNSDNQGISSGYWTRNEVYGTVGSTSANIDSSIFTVF